MKITSDSPDQDVRIELIPLIDVIFCILTFFILGAVTLTRQNAITIDLPRAETGTTQMRQMLIVSVDPNGQPYIEQEPVSLPELQQVLLNYQQVNPEGMIVLYAARATRYDSVVQVLDLLRSVGGDRVALATLPDAPGGIPTPNLEGEPGLTPGLEQPAPFDPFGLPDNSNPFAPNQDLFPQPAPLPAPGAPNPFAPTPAPETTP